MLIAAGTAVCAETTEDKAFAAWRAALWPDAKAFGITRATFDAAFAGVTPDLSLTDLAVENARRAPARRQAEFSLPPQAYVSNVYLARLAKRGRELAAENKDLLRQIWREIGVAPEAILAIWGRETSFGRARLKHDAIRALATQAFTGRRKDMFREELLYALKMLQDGVIERKAFRSSWAGALGLTQFMPSDYYAFAYDIDRDGKKDIWSVPDALASAAHQLRKKGWQSGRTWGFEVTLPAAVNCAMDGPGGARTIAGWSALGVRRADGQPFPEADAKDEAFLFTPGGGLGPAFLVLENFMVFKRYNASDLYALFVGHLADRIGGSKGFHAGWGGIKQLPARRIAAIQAHLKKAGFAISKVDGRIGTNTRSQIGEYELRFGLKPVCWPTARLLDDMTKRFGPPVLPAQWRGRG